MQLNHIAQKAAFVAEHFDASEVEALINKIHSAVDEDKELSANIAYNELLALIETTDEELTALLGEGRLVKESLDEQQLPPATGTVDPPGGWDIRITTDIFNDGDFKIYGGAGIFGGGGGGGTDHEWGEITLPGGGTGQVPQEKPWTHPGGPEIYGFVGVEYELFSWGN
jgi:hypothetical protein